MGGGVRRPSAQYTSNYERKVCSGKNTTESRSVISSAFHNVVDKRNPYRFKNWCLRPVPTPASLLPPAYSMSYLSRAMVAVSWILRMRVRHIKS